MAEILVPAERIELPTFGLQNRLSGPRARDKNGKIARVSAVFDNCGMRETRRAHRFSVAHRAAQFVRGLFAEVDHAA